jgi:methionyl-tRNA formyltransferase
MNTSKTIIFFGSGPVAAKSLEFLIAHFSIEAVITKPVPAHHKGTAPVEVIASQHNLPTLFAGNKKELDDIIAAHAFVSELGVIIDYGVIVSQSVIDAFPLGIINSHFSLLPEWRGADPITFSILSGQPKTGVSLMLIDLSLDTGKLLTRKSIDIAKDETTPTLTDRLIDLSNQLLDEYVPRYQNGDVMPKNQPHPDRATYSRKLTKQDGVIDWNKSADVIEREIRAFTGWPQSRTTLGSVDVIITRAHAVPSDAEAIGDIEVIDDMGLLMVGTGEGTLCIDAVKPVGKKEMPVQAFLRGYSAQLRYNAA